MNFSKTIKTIIISGLAALCALSVTIKEPIEKAEAFDGCSPATKGKYAIRVAQYGTIPSQYQSGAACKITTCVTVGKVANVYPGCDGADPSSILSGACIPGFIIGYRIEDATAPAGTPTCDSWYNTASHWVTPAQ